MRNQTRSALKIFSIALVIIAVAIRLGWLYIPILNGYNFWIVIIAYGVLLISSK